MWGGQRYWGSIGSVVWRPLTAVVWGRQRVNTRGVRRQGTKQAGETLLRACYPQHPHPLENFIAGGRDDAHQHLSQGPCPARRKRGSVFGGTSSLCGSFQPNSCQVCVSILPDATAAEVPKDGARVIFREQHIAFPQSSVWQGTGGDLAEEFEPPRPICPVGVFLFGWTSTQKGNIKCWHVSVHVKMS